MLLTLYYMAATWVQAARLSSIRKKISELLSQGAGLVLYQEPDLSSASQLANSVVDWEEHLRGVSSSLCDNGDEARVADLLWYRNPMRSCSILPQQRVDVSTWIAFPKEATHIPLKTTGKGPKELKKTDRLHLLIEAEYRRRADTEAVHHCELEEFGILHAWLASDVLGVILETDLEHLVRLCGCFMFNKLAIHDCLEMTRIQTVVIHGVPCNVVPLSWKLNGESVGAEEVEGATRGRASHGATGFGNGCASGPHGGPGRGDFDSRSRASSSCGYALSGVSESLSLSGSWASLSYPEQLQALTRAAREAVLLSREQVPVEGQAEIAVSVGVCSIELLDDNLSATEELDTFPEEASQLVSTNKTSRFDEPSLRTASAGARSSDSFCSLDSLSTTMPCMPISPRRSPAHSAFTSLSAAYSTLSLSSVSSTTVTKPPNVLIYSDSSVAQENVTTVLRNTLHRHKYTIYSMTRQSLITSPWMYNARLLVLCGSVPDALAPMFLSYMLNGGRILCLCSDFLHLVLPTFRTAEVRQHELVRFSYARWKNVPLMHHVFCYQASPVHTRFTTGDSSKHNSVGSAKPPATPTSIEVLDSEKQKHMLQVEVLGAEETWQTPSLLLATAGSGPGAGKVIFSQVHLEVDPSQYESEEGKYSTLRQSDSARREILRDILVNHLQMECGDNAKHATKQYTQAYFLGRHELKQEMMNSLQKRMNGKTLQVGELSLQFCGKGESPPPAQESLLPILMHSCPPTFSTVEYFDNLQSDWLGRLVIYSEVLSSSMDVLGNEVLWNGLAVIPRLQTGGKGRSGNIWLSPEGCAMSTVQFIVPTSSVLAQHASIVQHITATAVVCAVAEAPGVSNAIDIRLKWPNDLYAVCNDELIKIGGLVVSSTYRGKEMVFNIGTGINLDNKDPTTCINELIMLYNARTGSKVPTLSLEKFLALYFTELESLFNFAQTGKLDHVMDLYYKYWLHSNAEIVVRDVTGCDKPVTVKGVDEFGFLLVQEKNGKTFSVQPNENTFDMCVGLIAPK